ncbi:MAG: hemerythrin domain-containing protein [Chitinophagaceae bacterium]|nr:hemerythrin domain-containing protein [Chitinophagaceae bacterium]
MAGYLCTYYFYSMNEIKPIKRSVQLQPLSREHHDGLLFVWKIRQGINNHTSIEKLSDYTGWFWKNHIRPHFFQEEKVLLLFMEAAHPMAVQLRNEHNYIRELIIAIDKDADSHDFTSLANLLEKHIRFEERELFQFLEEHLSEKELAEIYEKLEKYAVACEEEWKDEFWLKKEIK